MLLEDKGVEGPRESLQVGYWHSWPWLDIRSARTWQICLFGHLNRGGKSWRETTWWGLPGDRRTVLPTLSGRWRPLILPVL